MRVLVLGGAGYIGSVATEELIRAGHEVTVYDDLSRGHREAVHPEAAFVHGDLADRAHLEAALKASQIDAVMHFAAWSQVGESVREPARYYRNNVAGGIAILDAMLAARVKRIVFSSTAATYGEPAQVPIEESDPQVPTNPYGETKLAFERALRWYAQAYDLRSVALRYFNAAGASARFGEDHEPETHIIPLVIQAAVGARPRVEIFGTDYATPDGTCIRDYIHVIDLARAHVLALQAMDGGSRAYNLGNGQGFSVREVIAAVERVTGRKVPVVEGPRRPGDPAVLVASSERIRRELGWSPRLADLDSIVATAWEWHLAHPHGYASTSPSPR